MKQTFYASLTLMSLLLITNALQEHSNNALLSQRTSLSFDQRFLENYVTKNGNLTLQKDSLGFYANVDFQYNPYDASDSSVTDPSMGTMGIALYSSLTIFTQSCLDFEAFSCSAYNCGVSSTTTSLNFPYFTAQGSITNANLYLDYSSWELNRSEEGAFVVTSCSSNAYSDYGSSRYGIIGLGMGNGSSANFISSLTFTASVNMPNLEDITANLLFGVDYAKKSKSSFIGTFQANENWEINAAGASIETEDGSNIDFDGSIIFDWDADAIGFPLEIYNFFIETLGSNGASCETGVYYQAECYYQGKLDDLPTIKITLQSQEIDIPPALYVNGINYLNYDTSDLSDTYVSNIQLNIKGINTLLSGASYVTPAYSNYIIFDQNFLSYYFAEFSLGGPTDYSISIYTPYTSSVVWPYIVGGIIGFIIIVTIIVLCIRRRQLRRLAQMQSKPQQVFLNQAPVSNQPLVNNPPVVSSQTTNIGYGQNVPNGYPQPQPQAFRNAPGYSNPQQSGNYPNPGQLQMYGNFPGYIPQQGQVPAQQTVL